MVRAARRRANGDDRPPFGEVDQCSDQLGRVLGDRAEVAPTGAGLGSLLGPSIVEETQQLVHSASLRDARKT